MAFGKQSGKKRGFVVSLRFYSEREAPRRVTFLECAKIIPKFPSFPKRRKENAEGVEKKPEERFFFLEEEKV